MMLHSSCLCGKVTWDIDQPLDFMSHCHCSRCRKAHGTPFASLVAGPATSFELHGGEHVTRWQSSAALARPFCSHCGSVVPGDPWESLVFVPVGNFLSDPGSRPMMHIFVGSKAPWYEITDSLQRHEAYPPGVDSPVLADRPLADAGGQVRGSCNCGGVAFVVEGKPLGAWYCHCARCRRGRSAAHAANYFVEGGGVRFTRGTDLVVSYKLPEAQRFTQSFCRICGAKTPRVDPNRNRAGIPMGSLDDDPRFRPQGHIFVGSKAPWFEITGDLPQHDEYPPGF
ncbi:MAG TPA: GFA family protein [Candidatus Acidoferrales bacterium]|nr:GFA family protein [Candidatus Acidoferrales bacterium]